jgi:hypothetical protein
MVYNSMESSMILHLWSCHSLQSPGPQDYVAQTNDTGPAFTMRGKPGRHPWCPEMRECRGLHREELMHNLAFSRSVMPPSCCNMGVVTADDPPRPPSPGPGDYTLKPERGPAFTMAGR